MFENDEGTIEKVQDDLKVDQNLEVILRLAASPQSIFEAGAEPLIK